MESEESKSPHHTQVTSDSKIVLSIKELITGIFCVLSIGVSIGGFVKVISDISKLGNQVDEMQKDLTEIKVQNGKTGISLDNLEKTLNDLRGTKPIVP